MIMTKLANSRHCFVCGLENEFGLRLRLDSPREGFVSGKISIPQAYQGWPGIVHGGIITAILDEAAGRTADTTGIPKSVYMTGTLKIRYRHPAKCDVPLLVEAELINRKGRVVTTKSRLLDESRQLLAEAEIIFVQLENDLGMDHHNAGDEWILDGVEEKSDDL
jgi:acyl-coenzyme A thioesterase PaaI-like protein